MEIRIMRDILTVRRRRNPERIVKIP